VPPDVSEEELEAVGRTRELLRRLEPCGLLFGCGLLRVGRGRGLCGALRRADLEPDALQLARQVLDLLIREVELERERLQLGRLQVPAFLCTLDERAGLVSLEQLVQLVLAQLSSVLSALRRLRQRTFSLYEGSPLPARGTCSPGRP